MSVVDELDRDTVVVGVLALQGAFVEHVKLLSTILAGSGRACEVRTPEQIKQCSALVIPGGESTTLCVVGQADGVEAALREFLAAGKPVWGTCAGCIILSKSLIEPDGTVSSQLKSFGRTLGAVEVETIRNAFGRQLGSFEGTLRHPSGEQPWEGHHGVFIRAPAIKRVVGAQVKVLATVQHPRFDEPLIAAVQQGNILLTTFHPELSDDPAIHRFFVEQFLDSGRPAKKARLS